MEANKILHTDIIDIIFDGRNKSYGAYELRREYNHRLGKAIIIMLVLSGLVLYFISRPVIADKIIPVFIPDTETGWVNDYIIPEEPKVQPKVAASSASAKVNPANPVIVTDATPVDPIPSLQSSPGSGADPGTAINFPAGPAGPSGDSSAQSNIRTDPAPAAPTVYTSVQVQAAFPGGVEAWRKYLQRNLDADRPLNNGAPPGTYRVIVRFIVSTDGSISDVEPETEHGYGMEKEAVNAIKRGPSWTPAQQNSLPVKAYRRQPITFVVPE